MEAAQRLKASKAARALFGDAFVEHYAAITDRPAHLLGELGHHFLVGGQDDVEELQHIAGALLDREPAPFLLCRTGGGDGRVDFLIAGNGAAHQFLAVDGGDADNVGHDGNLWRDLASQGSNSPQ